jgi:hypothetical protein
MPPSSAAAENVRQDSVTSSAGVTPGSMNELPAGSVTDAPKRLLPVTRRLPLELLRAGRRGTGRESELRLRRQCKWHHPVPVRAEKLRRDLCPAAFM